MDSTQSRIYKHVFLLAADVTKVADSYQLATEDRNGVLLADWRLKACKKLVDQNLAEKIVVVGWHDEEDEVISRSTVIRDLLIGEYGLNPQVLEVIEQKEDGTFGNIRAIVKYMTEENLSAEDCAFLTNFYHVPRAVRLFANEHASLITPLVAESFVPEEFTNIKNAYLSESFSKRLESELKKLGEICSK